MKRFRFSLEAVHNVREVSRDVAERALSEAGAAASAAATKLDDETRTRDEAVGAYVGSLDGDTLDTRDLALRADYLVTLSRRMADSRERLAQLEREREQKRAAVAEASRAAEVTNKLRERQRARHKLEAARHEQNDLDEMASVAAARRLNENR